LFSESKETEWSFFYKVHYGYKNTQGKIKSFQSSLVFNHKTKMVEVPDAADQRIKDLKAKYEEAKKTGNKAVAEKLGPLISGQKPMYNLDSNHYMNVLDAQGNIGILKLRHRAKKALDVAIKELESKGIDALSKEAGRYFVFKRSGTGLDTAFSVSVAQEKLKIEGVGEVNRDLVHVLTPEIINRAKTEAGDLRKLCRTTTAEEIERIVKSSDLLTGISPVIDEIFESKTDSSRIAADEDFDDGESEYLDTPAPSRTAKIAQVAEEIKAAPVVTSTPLVAQSDDDFLASLNL
jgi:hypothetical protein